LDQESSEAFGMCDGAGGDGHWRGDGWNLATSPDEEGGHEQDHEEEQDHQEFNSLILTIIIIVNNY